MADENPNVVNYPNWAVSVQCRANEANEAMDAAFAQGYSDADDGTKASFEHAAKAVNDFVSGQDGWFQIQASGSHPQNEDDRPHLSVAINPVATPHGVE